MEVDDVVEKVCLFVCVLLFVNRMREWSGVAV